MDFEIFSICQNFDAMWYFQVENVVIEDDCSITDDNVQGAGRRGMCGSCAAIKVAYSYQQYAIEKWNTRKY